MSERPNYSALSHPPSLIEIKENKQVEYFVSFCVMTVGANPMGHSCMLISQLDHEQADAKIEVINAIGVYSQYMPVLGFKPYAVANIKLEDMHYIVNREGLKHETYQILEQDVEKLLDVFYEDKLKIAQHKDKAYAAGQKQDVPMFNIFNKQNCKKYVLNAMNQIGIDTSHLSSFMEIPIFNSLDTMKISEKTHGDSDKTYYWLSPMRYQSKSKQSKASDTLNKTLQEYYADLYLLYSRSNKLLDIIKNRQSELAKLGKTVQEINTIEQDLLAINTEIEKVATYPKLITKEKILELNCKLTDCVQGHINKLEDQHLLVNIISILKDVLQELLLHAKSLLVSMDGRKDTKFNSLDRDVFYQIEQTEIADAKRGRIQHASDVLSDHTYRRARV